MHFAWQKWVRVKCIYCLQPGFIRGLVPLLWVWPITSDGNRPKILARALGLDGQASFESARAWCKITYYAIFWCTDSQCRGTPYACLTCAGVCCGAILFWMSALRSCFSLAVERQETTQDKVGIRFITFISGGKWYSCCFWPPKSACEHSFPHATRHRPPFITCSTGDKTCFFRACKISRALEISGIMAECSSFQALDSPLPITTITQFHSTSSAHSRSPHFSSEQSI